MFSDNVPDFHRCHQQLLGRGRRHFGLLLFANTTFPRHRHDAFVGRIVTALEAHPDDDGSSWIRWLADAS